MDIQGDVLVGYFDTPVYPEWFDGRNLKPFE